MHCSRVYSRAGYTHYAEVKWLPECSGCNRLQHVLLYSMLDDKHHTSLDKNFLFFCLYFLFLLFSLYFSRWLFILTGSPYNLPYGEDCSKAEGKQSCWFWFALCRDCLAIKWWSENFFAIKISKDPPKPYWVTISVWSMYIQAVFYHVCNCLQQQILLQPLAV